MLVIFCELAKPNNEFIEIIKHRSANCFFISKFKSITNAGTIRKPPPAPIIPVIIPTAMPWVISNGYCGDCVLFSIPDFP